MARKKKEPSVEKTTQQKWLELLEERGVKQVWVAKQTGLSAAHISNLLAGRVRLTFENKNKINKALGTYF